KRDWSSDVCSSDLAPEIALEISEVTISSLATPDLVKLYKFLCLPPILIPVRSTLNNTLSARGIEWYSLTFCPASLQSAAAAFPTAPAPITATGKFLNSLLFFTVSVLLLCMLDG